MERAHLRERVNALAGVGDLLKMRREERHNVVVSAFVVLRRLARKGKLMGKGRNSPELRSRSPEALTLRRLKFACSRFLSPSLSFFVWLAAGRVRWASTAVFVPTSK